MTLDECKIGLIVRRKKGQYGWGGKGTVTKIATVSNWTGQVLTEPVAYVKWATGTSSSVLVRDLVTGDTPTAPAKAVVSETVTSTHYTAGGTTYGTEAEARAAANGGPVYRCEWLDVMLAGNRKPRFQTRWTTI